MSELKLTWNCRHHPTDGWHEVGCPHQSWTKEQLQSALEAIKQFHDAKFPLLSVTHNPLHEGEE